MQPRPIPLRRSVGLAILAAPIAVALMTQAACARASVAQVDVYDRTGRQTLDVHRKFGRRWLAGEPGHEYAIRIRNCANVRVLAVVSVDGVNVISGQTAAPDQSGYVIEPGDYVTIEGWRKNLDRTAAFVFTDPAQSYAARTGRPDDVGVIGVALFQERQRQPVPSDIAQPRSEASADARAPAPAAKSAESGIATRQAPSLGTGHGRNEYSPAQWTDFERRSSTPDETVAFRYESRDSLVAMGVLPRSYPPRRDPDPFPGQLGFVPDP
jgi:hypothetical protein